jgi:hypothetical protein
MPKQFVMDVPNAELPSLLADLATEAPDIRIVSQEQQDGIVVVTIENTTVPDPPPPPTNNDPPPPPPPPPGSLKAAPGGKHEAVVNALIAGAIQHGLDPFTILNVVAIESMFNPTICNRSTSAAGLFQFIDDTWKSVGGPTFPGRGGAANGQAAGASVALQVDLGCKFNKSNADKLKAALGTAPDATRIYMAHQQGLGGALAILRGNPNAPITSVISEKAARLNGFGGMTIGQTIAAFGKLVQRKAADARAQLA